MPQKKYEEEVVDDYSVDDLLKISVDKHDRLKRREKALKGFANGNPKYKVPYYSLKLKFLYVGKHKRYDLGDYVYKKIADTKNDNYIPHQDLGEFLKFVTDNLKEILDAAGELTFICQRTHWWGENRGTKHLFEITILKGGYIDSRKYEMGRKIKVYNEVYDPEGGKNGKSMFKETSRFKIIKHPLYPHLYHGKHPSKNSEPDWYVKSKKFLMQLYPDVFI